MLFKKKNDHNGVTLEGSSHNQLIIKKSLNSEHRNTNSSYDLNARSSSWYPAVVKG